MFKSNLYSIRKIWNLIFQDSKNLFSGLFFEVFNNCWILPEWSKLSYNVRKKMKVGIRMKFVRYHQKLLKIKLQMKLFVHWKFNTFVTSWPQKSLKNDFTDDLMSPWNISENKIDPYICSLRGKLKIQKQKFHFVYRKYHKIFCQL